MLNKEYSEFLIDLKLKEKYENTLKYSSYITFDEFKTESTPLLYCKLKELLSIRNIDIKALEIIQEKPLDLEETLILEDNSINKETLQELAEIQELNGDIFDFNVNLRSLTINVTEQDVEK